MKLSPAATVYVSYLAYVLGLVVAVVSGDLWVRLAGAAVGLVGFLVLVAARRVEAQTPRISIKRETVKPLIDDAGVTTMERRTISQSETCGGGGCKPQ